MSGEKRRIAADGGKTIVIRWIAGYQFYQTMHADDDFLFRHFSGGRDAIPQSELHNFRATASIHGYSIKIYTGEE